MTRTASPRTYGHELGIGVDEARARIGPDFDRLLAERIEQESAARRAAEYDRRAAHYSDTVGHDWDAPALEAPALELLAPSAARPARRARDTRGTVEWIADQHSRLAANARRHQTELAFDLALDGGEGDEGPLALF